MGLPPANERVAPQRLSLRESNDSHVRAKLLMYAQQNDMPDGSLIFIEVSARHA
jgi:hypothetical protein